MEITINRNNENHGPYSEEQARQKLAAGQLDPSDLAITEGMTDWQPLGQLLSGAPAQPGPATAQSAGQDDDQRDFEYLIEGRPDYAFVTVQVPGEQTLKVENSAMATMSTNMAMKTKLKGGFKRLLTGENITVNEFTAKGGPGEIGIAPASPGDMQHFYLDGSNEIFLQSSAFVASSMSVELDFKWQGFKGFFSGEGLFLIRCAGNGDLWFNTYGALIEIDINGDYDVDTGHIVAFTSGLQYTIQKFGGLRSMIFSGEGLVSRFRGQGRLWIQTRQVPALAVWAHPYRPVGSSKSND